MESLHELTIKTFGEGLRAKKFSALEIAQASFAHIKKVDGEIGAFLSLGENEALRTAEAVDLALAKDEALSPLAGVPLAIKDNMCIKGQPATAGSKILEKYIASYDAHVIEKLKNAQAVFLGKTNLDEFAMGSSNENSAFKPVKNPHDHTRVPGGSSGGSAAAVAAHMAIAGLGSDTGGSVRQPAALCGVVGLKPTYGAVSRSGLIAMASSLDQIGPLTKTVEDAALLFDAIRGKDALDSTSSTHSTSSGQAGSWQASKDAQYDETLLTPDFEKTKSLVVGIPKEYFVDGLSAEVSQGVQKAMEKLKSLGVKFHEISLPHTKYALSTYYIIMPAEVSSNLARFDGIRYSRVAEGKNLNDLYLKNRGEGFGTETKRRIILGTFVLSSGYYDAYYNKAQEVRALITQDFDEAFKKVNVILTPVTPTSAFKLDEKTSDPMQMYLSDIFTIPVNLAGLPAISIPVERYTLSPESQALPIGFQLIGRHFREADILGLGQYYEKL